jgi:hypothetical protein
MFSPRYRKLRTFSAGRNLPPSASDPVLDHESIFSPRYRTLRTLLPAEIYRPAQATQLSSQAQILFLLPQPS